MPIVAEATYRYNLTALGLVSAAWEVNMPPGNVYAKVALNGYFEYSRSSDRSASISIKSIKKKSSDGVITQVDINSNSAYDPQMTNITVALFGYDVAISGIVIVDYWG